jgi:hypothetical protein
MKTVNEQGIPYTYFLHEVTAFENVEPNLASATVYVHPTEFVQRPLPLFLEGPVHYLRLFPQSSRGVIEAVRQSNLFDTDLRMYKVCESIQDETHELGRIWAYPRGWIENESIYTHMEYKWLLEILRSGQADIFYQEMKNLLPPFISPDVYGRSTIENCSFIVSSAYPDSKLHGKAFQPRLSGTTAEWLEIWTLMVSGSNPFQLDSKGRLSLIMKPLLPDWLFTEEDRTYRYWDPVKGWEEVNIPADSFAFRFLGQILVIYHNPKRGSTFSPEAVGITGCTFRYADGSELKQEGHTFNEDIAKAVRNGQVRRMDVTLG